MAKLFYKPFGLIFSVLGGIVAGMIFKRIWGAVGDEDEAPEATRDLSWGEVLVAARGAVGDEDEAPEATDETRGWGEVLVAAAAEGAVFGAVKALVRLRPVEERAMRGEKDLLRRVLGVAAIAPARPALRRHRGACSR